MKTVETLLSELRRLDVQLWLEGDRLRYRAPKGTLNPDLLTQLREHKADILSYLHRVGATNSHPASLKPVPRGEVLPLSPTQQRLWFLDQLEPGNPTYNMTAALRLQGHLHIAALEQSIQAVVRRHESLRTTFPTVEGQPRQIISPAPSFPISVIDLQPLPPEQQDAATQQHVKATAQHRFNLAQGPLLQVKLLCLSQTEHILLLTMHHIVSDGWSFGILYRELSALYTAFLAEQPSPLPDLPIQYADYAHWQCQWLQTDAFQSQLSYWKQHLGGQLPILDLPTDYPRSTTQTFAAESHTLELSGALSNALKTLSQTEGVTLFMTLLAAFKILLSRYSGKEDIIVGAPIAGRNRVETEGLIGFFINTLVLRSHLANHSSFRQVLRHVRDVTLEAQANQDVPFEKLVEELQPERELGRTPIFQVWFNMLNLEQFSLQLPHLEIEPLRIPSLASKFDLSVYIRDSKNTLQLKFVYNKALFKCDRMLEMLAQFEHLLQQLIDNPNAAIADFSLVTSAAASRLPNPTDSLNGQHEGFIHQSFVENALQYSNRIAVMDAQTVWTYGTLHTRSNQLANYLLQHQIQPGNVVAIYGHRSSSLVWAILGVLKAGAAFVVLDPAYPAARLINYLQIASPKAWIQLEGAGQLPQALQEDVDTLSLACSVKLPHHSALADNDPLASCETHDPRIAIAPDTPAYITFTSGSTGQPKGVLGTHTPISHFLQWYCQTFEFNASDRFSLLSGLAHDPLLRDIFTPLSIGATLCIPDAKDIERSGQLATWMKTQQISVAHLTPAMGQLLTESASSDILQTLRYVCFGGDVLTHYDIVQVQKLAPDATCINFYGATETPQAMGYYVVPHDEAATLSDRPTSSTHQIPIGKGIQDVQLLILNAAQQLAGVGEVGEIWVRTPYLSKGYVNNESLTQSRFVRNPWTTVADDMLYKTGDYGRYQPDGTVEFVGRQDHQVKIRGFRIELGEIEATLADHPGVQRAIAITHTETSDNPRLIAYVVPVEGRSLTSEELRTFLQARLPHYMMPSAFILLESIPLTPNGKVNRRALFKLYQSRQQSEIPNKAPQDELELQLKRIWEDVLGVQSIDVHDNFFDLGGHSLLAVQLFTQLKQRLDQDLPLVTLFQAPSIAQLANILRQQGWSPCWSALVPVQPQGSKPPFFFHGGAADALSWKRFANLLGPDQPFYALQRPDLDGRAVTQTTVEALAAHCIEEMRTVQPQGPYFIGGHCFGGVVAFEIACQLQAKGEKVALLAIIDSYAPKPIKVTPLFQCQKTFYQSLFWLQKNYYYHGRLDKLLQLTPLLIKKLQEKASQIQTKLHHFSAAKTNTSTTKTRHTVHASSSQNHLKDFVLHNSESNLSHEMRYQRAEVVNRSAKKQYTPSQYAGRILILRAQQQSYGWYFGSHLGWQELATDGVKCVNIPGFSGNLFNRDSAPILAEELRNHLETVQTKSTNNTALCK